MRAKDTITNESKALIADTRSLTVFSQTDDVRRANLVESAVTDINNRCHLVSLARKRAAGAAPSWLVDDVQHRDSDSASACGTAHSHCDDFAVFVGVYLFAVQQCKRGSNVHDLC